jgi:hypothetical protein
VLKVISAADMAEVVNTEALERAAASGDYSRNTPFPHIVIEDFLRDSWFEAVVAEFPTISPERWTNYSHVNERKFANPNYSTWGDATKHVASVLNSAAFVEWLGALTGIKGLIIDESFEGGGMHQSITGGYLNVHADFTVHPHNRHWQRRVNLLLYCNQDWRGEYGGELELWTRDMKRCEKRVAPLRNRVLIFNTDMDSFHGHPDPLTTPVGVARQSLALYYFTEEDAPVVRSTEYRARPGDGAKRALIYADKQALRGFDWAKRKFNLSNDAASRVLGVVEKLRRRKR